MNSASDSSSDRRSTRDLLDELSRSLTEAILRGGRDARRTFDETFPKVKSDAAKGVHDLAYAAAYAATFGAALLREAVPGTVRDGWREGSEAGRKAAADRARRRDENAAGGGSPASGGTILV